jgi:hypothetical protein
MALFAGVLPPQGPPTLPKDVEGSGLRGRLSEDREREIDEVGRTYPTRRSLLPFLWEPCHMERG